MDRSIIRNAGLSLVLCAGLGMGVVAMANQAYAETTTDKAAATETADKAATTDQKADEKAATTDQKADEKAADTKDAKADEKAADTKDAAAATLKDGEYKASSKGIGGDVPVTVTIKDGKIAKVEVGENSETEGIGSKAIEQLPDAIVKANGTEGVDAVSGASVTSKAIFDAVNDCMDQAKKAAGTTDKAAADTKDAKAADTKADETKDAKAADAKDEKASDTKDAAATDKAAETTTEAKAETK